MLCSNVAEISIALLMAIVMAAKAATPASLEALKDLPRASSDVLAT